MMIIYMHAYREMLTGEAWNDGSLAFSPIYFPNKKCSIQIGWDEYFKIVCPHFLTGIIN